MQLNGIAQLAGGLLLAPGHFTRPSAAVLAGTLIPTTVAGHPFWSVKDPAERRGHEVHFLKNLGLLGGLLLAGVRHPGQARAAWRASHAVDHASSAATRGQRSLQRTARTARREARLAMRAAAAGRHLPG